MVALKERAKRLYKIVYFILHIVFYFIYCKYVMAIQNCHYIDLLKRAISRKRKKNPKKKGR